MPYTHIHFITNPLLCIIYIAIFLHSTTGPIIESSSNISIGCYNYAYFGLESNLLSANMSIWENEWYSVYDFTPANNFKLLPTGDPSTCIETVIPVSLLNVIIVLPVTHFTTTQPYTQQHTFIRLCIISVMLLVFIACF